MNPTLKISSIAYHVIMHTFKFLENGLLSCRVLIAKSSPGAPAYGTPNTSSTYTFPSNFDMSQCTSSPSNIHVGPRGSQALGWCRERCVLGFRGDSGWFSLQSAVDEKTSHLGCRGKRYVRSHLSRNDLFVKRSFTKIKHIFQVYFPSLRVNVRIPTIAKSFSSGGRRISISSREYLDLYIVVHRW